MDAHARERHVSTIGMWAGLGFDVYVVPGRCDVRSTDPRVCFRVGHVSTLSLFYDSGKCGTYSGSVLGALFRAFSLLKPTSMARYGSGYPYISGSGGMRIVRCVSRGGGAVCAPPPQPACGGGLCGGPPLQQDW